MYGFKECSSCGALYNKSCGCSKGGFVDKFVRDPNKTPDSSQRPPHNCPKCGNPVDGLYCRQCALLRKKLEEVWFTICDENEIFQDFLNTSESSNDNTNVVNAPQEPFVFNQDPGKNSSQSPPHIDHHCCYGCGDSLDGIFCQRCTCESCGNGAHYGYNCPPKVPIISNPEPCYNQNVDEFPQTLLSLHPTCYSGDENSFTYDSNLNFVDDSSNPPPQPPTYSYEFCGNDAHYGHYCPPQVSFIYNPEPCYNQDFNFPQNFQMRSWQILLNFYQDDDEDDDEEYTIAITPVLPTVEPDNSLSMGDKHLSTILEKEESSVEDLVPIPSESEGISDSMCDVPFCDNSTPLEASKDHFEILLDSNDDYSSSVDDSLYSEDIDYVEASPPDYELVSLEVVKDFDREDGVIDTDILLTIKDDILCEKLLNINLLIAKIEALKDNPIPSSDFKSSGNPASYTDLSLPDYEAFFYDSEPNSGDFTMDVVEDIFDNLTRKPRVHVPNVLTTHPTLHLDLDFTLSSDSLGSDLVVSFPSGTRNKIFDPGIFIKVQSKRFLSPNEFSISFIHDLLSPVFDTLLPFLSENEDKDCPDFEASRARGFVIRSLELQSFA
ncbi:hypothetical protein Tco_1411038 [Tanacetum coccineum]